MSWWAIAPTCSPTTAALPTITVAAAACAAISIVFTVPVRVCRPAGPTVSEVITAGVTLTASVAAAVTELLDWTRLQALLPASGVDVAGEDERPLQLKAAGQA